MAEHTIPLIIRGKVIEDDLVDFAGRHGASTIRTPDVNRHYASLVMTNPDRMQDLYDIPLSEIVDYLDELGRRLAPASNPHIRKAIEISAENCGHSREMLDFMYTSIPNILRRGRVEEVIRQTIGVDYLEGWVEARLADRTTRVRAMGSRAVHINAGNAPAIALVGIMMNAITRSDAIMKSPSNDPFTAAAVALTMIDMAPDHPLTRHLSVAYWKGGDAGFEKRLYRPSVIEKIVAWGGFASMQHIRGYLGPGMDLIALDPKLSCAIIGEEAFASPASMQAVAERLAMDFGYLNQEGCINPRVCYVQSGTDDEGVARLNALGEMAFAELHKLPSHLSSPHPAFDTALRDEIQAIRFSNFYRVIGGAGAEGAVIVSQSEEPVEFADLLGCRVLNLVPIDDLKEGLDHVNGDTSSVAVYPDQLKDRISMSAALRGAQRITSLGMATAEGNAQPHDAMEPLRRLARWIVIEDFTPDQFGASGIVYGS